MHDSPRAHRSIDTVIASAVAANLAGAWAFIAAMDELPRLSSSVGIPLTYAGPAAIALLVVTGGYEGLVRLIRRLPLPRPVDAVHVQGHIQAAMMLTTSVGAGVLVGAILESSLPTESWSIFFRGLVGALWGLAFGVVSGGTVWWLSRLSR